MKTLLYIILMCDLILIGMVIGGILTGNTENNREIICNKLGLDITECSNKLK